MAVEDFDCESTQKAKTFDIEREIVTRVSKGMPTSKTGGYTLKFGVQTVEALGDNVPFA